MRLEIERSTGKSETFEVPEFDGMTVLDAVMWIREHHDPSLGVRFSCRSANACRECVCVVDGKPDYICTVAAVGDVHVGPLPNKPRLHDLGVDQ